MKKKVTITGIIFLMMFFWTLLSEKYIGQVKTYSKPLKWDEIQQRIPFYILLSTGISFLAFYQMHKEDKEDKEDK